VESDNNSENDSLLDLILDEEEIKLILGANNNSHSLMNLFLQQTNVAHLSSYQFAIDP